MDPATTDAPGVSVVLPVLDEERHLQSAVRSVLAQDFPGPVEVVLALGPSRDRTNDVARELAALDPRVHLVENPTGHRAAGLNLAIAASRYDVIARLDGHSVLPPTYLATAVRVLEDTGADNVGGLMWAEGVTDFEQAVARALTSKVGVGNAPFHVGGAAGAVDTVYLGVFRRTALERVGGYDESWGRAEDWELNYRIRSSGGTVWFSPDLSVSYRPRGTLRLLAAQYFHYGRWRHQMMRRYPDSVTLRYLAPPVAVVGVTAGVVAGALGRREAWLLPAGYAGLVLGAAAVSGPGLPVRARLTLPAVLATMHGSWGLGWLTTAWRKPR